MAIRTVILHSIYMVSRQKNYSLEAQYINFEMLFKYIERPRQGLENILALTMMISLINKEYSNIIIIS